jgi:alpha-glucosidase
MTGSGDLAGIIHRLHHVAELGVDAIWISPFFRSPMLDFGYDVSDYRDVDPMFGTLGDFDALIHRAHELGLKVLIDLVLSHTSNQHAWFQESVSSRDNPRPTGMSGPTPSPMAARPTTGCRSSAARPGNGRATGCSTTCTTSSRSSPT